MANLVAPPDPATNSFGVAADGEEGTAALSAAYPGASTSRDVAVRAPEVEKPNLTIGRREGPEVPAAHRLQVPSSISPASGIPRP